MKHLHNNRGETLMESLVSLLIVTLTFALIATVAAAASKLNDKVRRTDISFQYNGAQDDGSLTVTASGTLHNAATGRDSVPSVTLYESNGYYYYCTPGGNTP